MINKKEKRDYLKLIKNYPVIRESKYIDEAQELLNEQGKFVMQMSKKEYKKWMAVLGNIKLQVDYLYKQIQKLEQG